MCGVSRGESPEDASVLRDNVGEIRGGLFVPEEAEHVEGDALELHSTGPPRSKLGEDCPSQPDLLRCDVDQMRAERAARRDGELVGESVEKGTRSRSRWGRGRGTGSRSRWGRGRRTAGRGGGIEVGSPHTVPGSMGIRALDGEVHAPVDILDGPVRAVLGRGDVGAGQGPKGVATPAARVTLVDVRVKIRKAGKRDAASRVEDALLIETGR